MNLDDAVRGLLKVREELRSKRGITDPLFLSQNMQRLTQYTGAVEEHLADMEEQLEAEMMGCFESYMKQGKTPSAAETLVKYETKGLKGNIARLKRLVNSSWSIISTAQSRINHIKTDMQQNGRIT